MAAIQIQDTHGVVNDPSTGAEYQTLSGVYNEQAAAAGFDASQFPWSKEGHTDPIAKHRRPGVVSY